MEPLETATKFNTKTLCTFFFRLKNPREHCCYNQNISQRGMQNHNYQNYISCLVLVLLSGHLRQFCVQAFSTDTKLHELALQRGELGRLYRVSQKFVPLLYKSVFSTIELLKQMIEAKVVSFNLIHYFYTCCAIFWHEYSICVLPHQRCLCASIFSSHIFFFYVIVWIARTASLYFVNITKDKPLKRKKFQIGESIGMSTSIYWLICCQ